MSGSEDDRASRLRERRHQAKEKARQSEEADESSSTKSDSAGGSVKDEHVGMYMYVPESQKKEIQRLYTMLKADYEYEYDTAFEKNRHFYPLLVSHGLDGLDGLDASEVRELLDRLDGMQVK